MKKPDWKDAPDGYNYLAQDRSGVWYWHKEKPFRGMTAWTSGEYERASDIPDWENSLEERPGQFNDLKVGDWVLVEKHCSELHLFVSAIYETSVMLSAIRATGAIRNYGMYFKDNGESNPATTTSRIIRKLEPEEVIIEIGVLRGRVLSCSCCQNTFYLIGADNEFVVNIDFDMLPEDLQKIVKDLLAKQKEKSEIMACISRITANLQRRTFRKEKSDGK